VAVWHPNAKKVVNLDAGDFQGSGGRKLVWHTTEGSSLPNYGGSSPHFTINPGTGDLWQHIPIDKAARALMVGMILGGDADPALPRLLARGDQGANVLLLKQRLEKAHGYRLDTSDDGFGKMTEAAVVHFQWRHGMVPDGVVGPVTWSAIWD
jgi:hypothetical protein